MTDTNAKKNDTPTPVDTNTSSATQEQNPFVEAGLAAAPSGATHAPSPDLHSTTATTATTVTTVTTPPVTTHEQDPAHEAAGDPRIAPLKAMFPDYDDLILLEVLTSVGDNQDRAIDTLLGMSDPEYQGEHIPAEPIMSQTELDEQLARRLMLEDQEQQQAAWQAQQDARRQQRPQQPAASAPQLQPRLGSGQQGGDTMAEIQQQLGKMAETGKKTFGNIFSKVKAKIQEMDQPKSSGSNPSAWTGSYDPGRYEQQQAYQTQTQPHLSYEARPPQLPPVNAAPSPSPPIALHGYDTPSIPQPITTPPTSDTPRPSVTSSGTGGTSAPIDGGKLGLLPKRPVSLLRPDTIQHTESQSSSHDDTDDLEYAESPFEEPKNKAERK